MKKKMSRFLSGILSAATLSTMISINPVKVAGLGSTDFMRTFSEAYRHDGKLPDNNVSKTLTEIDVDEFVNEIIYKSIGLIKTHLGERSEAFTKEFTSRIIKKVPTGELSNDQKLNFACIFTHTLLETIREKTYDASSSTEEQFNFFDTKVIYMSLIIKKISTRSDISDYVKEKCVRDILDTLKGMPGLSEEIDCYYLNNLERTVDKLDPSEMKDAIAFFSKTREMFYTERKNNRGNKKREGTVSFFNKRENNRGIDRNIEKIDNATLGITKNGVAEELLAACKSDHDPWDVAKSPTEIDKDVLRSVIISKTIKLIEKYSGKRSKDFIKELISRTIKAMPVDGYSPDQKLEFARTFNNALKEVIREKVELKNEFDLSADAVRQLGFLSDSIVGSILSIAEDLPNKPRMSYVAKAMCVKEVCQVLKNLDTKPAEASFNLMFHLSGALNYDDLSRTEETIRLYENYNGN